MPQKKLFPVGGPASMLVLEPQFDKSIILLSCSSSNVNDPFAMFDCVKLNTLAKIWTLSVHQLHVRNKGFLTLVDM